MIFFRFSFKMVIQVVFLASFSTCKGTTPPLIEAIQRLKPSVVEQLLDSDQSEQYLKELLDDESGPLHLACRISDSEDGYSIFKMLLRAGSCPKQVNKLLETAIHDSCYIKNLVRRNDVIEDLLLYGGRLLQEDKSGKTIMERLVDLQSQKDLEGFLNRFGYLISDEDLQRTLGFIGTHAGEGRGFTDLAVVVNKFMHEKKQKNFIELVLSGDLSHVQEAVSKNPSLVVSKEVRWGLSPLMISLLRSDRKMVEFLIDKNSSMTIEDSSGKSPLHIAVEGCIEMSEKREFVRMLIKKGAHIEQLDHKKRTAVSIGIKKGLEKEIFDLKEIKR